MNARTYIQDGEIYTYDAAPTTRLVEPRAAPLALRNAPSSHAHFSIRAEWGSSAELPVPVLFLLGVLLIGAGLYFVERDVSQTHAIITAFAVGGGLWLVFRRDV